MSPALIPHAPPRARIVSGIATTMPPI